MQLMIECHRINLDSLTKSTEDQSMQLQGREQELCFMRKEKKRRKSATESWTKTFTRRIWWWVCGHRCSSCSIEVWPNELHELIAKHCISLTCCITLTTRKMLSQLTIWINSRVNSTRNPIYWNILLPWKGSIGILHTVKQTGHLLY